MLLGPLQPEHVSRHFMASGAPRVERFPAAWDLEELARDNSPHVDSLFVLVHMLIHASTTHCHLQILIVKPSPEMRSDLVR